MAKDPPEAASAIDVIIERIGGSGAYQKRFTFLFNMILPVLAAMPYMNMIISLVSPDHWCHVPGREHTNYTMDEWKNLTIPREVNSQGLLTYAKCSRYALPTQNWSSTLISLDLKENTVKCDNGWDYDHTWYDMTAPIKNNWVCDDQMVPSNAIAIGFVGEVVGTLIFAQMADIWGRRPIFFLALIAVVSGRVICTFTSTSMYAFFVFNFIGSLTGETVMQGPLVIAMEISDPKNRGLIGMLLFCGWNIGMSIMPLLMWWLRDWVTFLLATTLPCAIYLFSWPWIIESPRWLASKGKINRCLRELRKIAKSNKTSMPPDAEARLIKFYELNSNEKHHSILGLISSLRLAKNCFLISCIWSIILQIYISLAINVANLAGNPFLNYLYQSLAELPAFVIAKYISDRFGRRYTSIISFTLTFLGCVTIVFIINDPTNAAFVRGLCIFVKFAVMMAYYSVHLQALEIYPTCIRQIGLSSGAVLGCTLGTLAPYIIALGATVDATLPFLIFTVCAIVGAVSTVFLPETKGYQLPETLADAAIFGADQDIWGRSFFTHVDDSDNAEVPFQTITA